MYINSYGQVVSDDYLAHHGILGQKWGQRNGPPYPLDANAHSAAEKRLKGKNDGKLESWKAKKTAKIEKSYTSKIRRSEKKLSNLQAKGKNDSKTVRKINQLNERIQTLKDNKEVDKAFVMSMSMKEVKRSQIRKGALIASSAVLAGGIGGLSVAAAGTLGGMAAKYALGLGLTNTIARLAVSDRDKIIERRNKQHRTSNDDGFLALSLAKSRSKDVKSMRSADRILTSKKSESRAKADRASSMKRNGLSYNEIAKALNVSPGTAYYLVNFDEIDLKT